jgi:Cys-tRNA(Pro)/Cys-tRNA(Cys) deacylase
MENLQKLHKNVQAALRSLEGKYKIHDHRDFETKIKNPSDFATVLRYHVQRITKTVFLCSNDGRYSAAVCSADKRLDLETIAGALGTNRVQVASPEDLRVRTGYPRNGVSPLGLNGDIVVIMDGLLFEYSTVLVGGGATAIEVELSPADLARVSGATVQGITT